jgi:alpha-tubulin suppressor-like RCC1 family protein
MAIKVNGTIAIDNDKHCTIGSGTTAQRPTSPAVATLWFNTETNNLEGYNGAEWENVTEPLPPPPPLAAWSWGRSSSGKLGDNTLISRSSPVSVVGGFTDWVQISASGSHNVALRENGTLWAWGSGASGRLGTNDIINRSSPVSVVGGITDWTKISAGGSHNLAQRADGSLWAWGSNTAGQLGANDAIATSSPVSVVGGITDWTKISAGGTHNLAIRSNGTLWAWGSGGQGRLGTNDIINRSSPVSVIGGFADWTEASAGGDHSLALRANGTIWAWGSDANTGRLGTGQIGAFDRSSPVSIVGGITDWVEIATGDMHNLAIRSNGTLWAWGSGTGGMLGDNQATTKASPVSVVGGFTDWSQISGGDFQTVAIRSNGTLWAFGAGGYGRLGTNDLTNRSSPVSVVGGFTDWVRVSTSGGTHSLALRLAE